MNITFLLVCLCFLMCYLKEIGGSINNSTACYGANGLPCSSHILSCASPLVIQIINTTYGYRAGCNDVSGKSNCVDDQCCREEPFDCFTLFSDDDSLKVHAECNGHTLCRYQGRRRLDVFCTTRTIKHGISAYSKIQYDCVSNDSVPTLFTDRPDVLQPDIKTSYDSIIVGVISTITILVIIILVTILIYKIRHKQTIKSQEDNHAVLSTRDSYTAHYTSIDDASAIDRSCIGEYEDVELDDHYSTSASVDNLDKDDDNSLNCAMIRSSNTEKFMHSSDTPTNYDHILSFNTNNFQITDRNNYDHINDVQYPVGGDDYNHIGDHDKQEKAFDDNYNHISA